MSGKIVIQRDFMFDELFDNTPASQREAWLDLIGMATFKARRFRIGKANVSLDPGELATSYRFLGERWQWTKDRVARYLLKLAENRRITTRTETVNATTFTLITICNYCDIQDFRIASETTNETANETRPRQHRDATATNQSPDLTPYGTPDPIPRKHKIEPPPPASAVELTIELAKIARVPIGNMSDDKRKVQISLVSEQLKRGVTADQLIRSTANGPRPENGISSLRFFERTWSQIESLADYEHRLDVIAGLRKPIDPDWERKMNAI